MHITARITFIHATVFDGKAFDSDGAGGYGRGVDQKWITCLTSIFAPFVLIVTSSFLISPLEHSLRASAVMCTLHNVFIRCSFVDCCHWICVDRKPMRKESPFSRTVILRIVFYEIRKTGNGSLFFRCILWFVLFSHLNFWCKMFCWDSGQC